MSGEEKKETVLEKLAKVGAPDNKERTNMIIDRNVAHHAGIEAIKGVKGYDKHNGVGLSIDKIRDYLATYLQAEHYTFFGGTIPTGDKEKKHLKKHFLQKVDQAMDELTKHSREYHSADDLYKAIQEDGLEVFIHAHHKHNKLKDKIGFDRENAYEIIGHKPEGKNKFAELYAKEKKITDKEEIKAISLNAHSVAEGHIQNERAKARQLHESYHKAA